MGALVYMPVWVLEDLGLDVSVGDRVDWSVSPLDHDWFDARFEGFTLVDLEYEYDLDHATGTLAGTVLSIRVISKRVGGRSKVTGTAGRFTRSTASARHGRPPARGFVFEVEPGS